MNITVETITPEVAAELLQSNTRNRGLNAKYVQALAAEMRDGNWQMAGDPIRISVSMVLLDGQHRLSAIVESGTTQQMVVINDLPDETFAVMDTGRMRSAGDVLDIAGVPNSRLAASAARMIINYQRGVVSGTLKNQGRAPGQWVTNSDIRDFTAQNDLQSFLLKAKSWYKEWRMFTASEYAFFSFMLSQIDPEAAVYFLTALTKGADLPATSPIFLLRKKIEQYKLNKISYTPSERLALVFKSWNLYRSDKTVSNLYYNSEKEDFPTPI